MGINAQQPQRCHNLSRVAIHVPVGLVLVNRGGDGRKIMFIGKCSENGPLGFGERGRVGDFGGGGVSLNVSSSPCTLFWYDRKESE